MSRSVESDLTALEPGSDPCSLCGLPVARVPMLYTGKDDADPVEPKVVCNSCLERRSRRKKTWAFLGGVFWWIEYGGFFFWVASIIIVAIAAALINLFAKH